MKFSGLCVTCNDELHLKECLESISFCDEVIVVDLHSTDRSREIAIECGARVVEHEWVPAVEFVREYAVGLAHNEWVMVMDPDTVFPTHLAGFVMSTLEENPEIGIVECMQRYYFLGKPIRYGRWGGFSGFPAIYRKGAIEIRPLIHRSNSFRPGVQTITLSYEEKDLIKHYWADSLGQFLKKQKRYIRMEGSARYQLGERYHFGRIVLEVPRALISSLILRKGFMDGWRGVYLSFFYAWYNWRALLSLKQYQSVQESSRRAT